MTNASLYIAATEHQTAGYTAYGALFTRWLILHLFLSALALIVLSLAESLYRPARLESVQIDKAPGSVHWRLAFFEL